MDNPVNSDLQTSFQISAKISVVEGNMRRTEYERVVGWGGAAMQFHILVTVLPGTSVIDLSMPLLILLVYWG